MRFFLFLFCAHGMACRTIPSRDQDPCRLQRKHRVPTTGLPGKSQEFFLSQSTRWSIQQTLGRVLLLREGREGESCGVLKNMRENCGVSLAVAGTEGCTQRPQVLRCVQSFTQQKIIRFSSQLLNVTLDR